MAVRPYEEVAMETYMEHVRRTKYPDAYFIITKREPTKGSDGKNILAPVDGFIIKDHESNEILSVFELKCRFDANLDTFMGPWKGEWLVSYSKIQDGRILSQMFGIPLMGFLHVVRSKTVLWVVIWSEEQGTSARYVVDYTETKATINGGKATRANAYIDMRGASSAKVNDVQFRQAEAASREIEGRLSRLA